MGQNIANISERYFSALLSDCMDLLGWRNQALPASIRPLDDTLVMAGRARPALYAEVLEIAPGENPYELEIALIDSLKPDEIPVFSCGRSGRIAPWGELLSTAAQVRGSRGALMDGFVRDTRAIREIGFPVFHGGISPLDSKWRGKVIAIDVMIECAGVRVQSGDLVFGDADGVVVVPQEIESRVFEVAEERLSGERNTLAELRAGEKLADVYKRYGTL